MLIQIDVTDKNELIREQIVMNMINLIQVLTKNFEKSEDIKFIHKMVIDCLVIFYTETGVKLLQHYDFNMIQVLCDNTKEHGHVFDILEMLQDLML